MSALQIIVFILVLRDSNQKAQKLKTFHQLETKRSLWLTFGAFDVLKPREDELTEFYVSEDLLAQSFSNGQMNLDRVAAALETNSSSHEISIYSVAFECQPPNMGARTV